MSGQWPLNLLPIFSIANFSALRHMHYECIVVDGEVFHRVCELAEFYKIFGYVKEINVCGVMPDEFIWDTYTRYGAPKSRNCIQFLVMTYLNIHSKKFRENYGIEYDELVGKCVSDKITPIKYCADCMLHPVRSY